MKFAWLRPSIVRQLGRASPRARILVWAALVALVVGMLDIGEPVDLVARDMRDFVRSRPSDGTVVVVRVDNQAIQGFKSWPPKRARDAEAVDALFALGARRVFYDRLFADPSPVGDDPVFAAALKRHHGRVFLAAQFSDDQATGKREAIVPVQPLRSVANIGSIVIRKDILGYTTGVPFKALVSGKTYPSFSSIIAERGGDNPGLFRPDYSINLRSIPSLSLADVYARAPSTSAIAGRDVVIGVTAPTLGDVHSLPGQGLAPGVFIHVIGAETLRHRMPSNIGWLPLYLAVLALCAVYLHARRSRLRLVVGLAAVALVGLVPFVLDSLNIASEMTPAALLFIIVAVRTSILARVVNNPITGLPMLDRISRDEATFNGTIVGLKIGNYADLRSTLTTVEERLVIAEVVRRLRVGDADLEVVQGDDSFIWRSNLAPAPRLFGHIEGLHAVLSQPIELGTRRVDLTLAFGLDGDTDRDVPNRIGSVQVSADDALSTGAKWKVHDVARLVDADFRLSLLSRLDLALANGEIWVAYQAKLDLKKKQLSGSEALVRWSHPERGLIGPDKFIPVAEAANRISGLTYFVLETAIRDTAALVGVSDDFGVAVNLSVRMLNLPGFVGEVEALLVKHDLAPGRLTLEVTESAEIDFTGPALQRLCELRDLGLKVSIDDYGTRFSTLDYVRQLPASEIKIDQCFIRTIHENENARIMVRSTIELAHSLGLSVVAEGVELPATMAALADMNCDVIQGYLIAKPQPIDRLSRFVSFAAAQAAA